LVIVRVRVGVTVRIRVRFRVLIRGHFGLGTFWLGDVLTGKQKYV